MRASLIRVRAPSLARLGLRWGLAGLFLYAGVMKLADPTAFAVEIDRYQLWPELAPYFAAGLPLTELTLGTVLMVGPKPWQRAAALSCALLLAAFTYAAAAALARGLNIDCGCFGGDSGPITWLTLVRDGLLLAAAAWCAAPESARVE